MTAAALLGAAAPALGQEIYRWVDEDGVVHFSDTSPATPLGGSVATVVIEDTRPSDYDPDEDRYDVAGQAERMQALRQQMEEQREARSERERSLPVRDAQPGLAEPAYALPPWWSRPGYGRPPGRPPRPELPIEPPAQPPTSTLRPPPWSDG